MYGYGPRPGPGMGGPPGGPHGPRRGGPWGPPPPPPGPGCGCCLLPFVMTSGAIILFIVAIAAML